MEWYEILTIILASSIVLAVFGTWLYRKFHHLPTGCCKECHASGNKMLEEYHKKYKCPNCHDD